MREKSEVLENKCESQMISIRGTIKNRPRKINFCCFYDLGPRTSEILFSPVKLLFESQKDSFLDKKINFKEALAIFTPPSENSDFQEILKRKLEIPF